MFYDYYIKNKESIDRALDNSKYPNTAKALKRSYLKLCSISNVIQNIDCQSDSYTSYILIRSFVEHFLVAYFIWIKFHLDKNDKTASIYYKEYVIQELVKKINYTKANKINPSSRYLKLFSFMYDRFKEKGLLKEKYISNLNRAANIFNIRKISSFVESNIPEGTEEFLKPKRIKEMLEFYNYYSTFVHGGPAADLAIFESKDDAFIQIADAFKIWSKNILGALRFIILYFISYEDKEIEKGFVREIERLME
jgi:hypothetical protein